MTDAVWKEYDLYCPVCDCTFKQLIVLPKVPKNYDIAPVLANAVASHNHKEYQEAMAKKQEADGESDPK